MKVPLKTYNNSKLTIVFGINVLVLAILAFNIDIIKEFGVYDNHLIKAIAVPVLGIIVYTVNSLLSPANKAKIVFWRYKNPLPGARAFSSLGPKDPRVDMALLENKFGPIPSSPLDQNKLWYKIYQEYSQSPSVLQAHKAYLFGRDYAVFSLLFICALGISGFFLFNNNGLAFVYLICLVAQYVLVSTTAQTSGKSFVTNVLALASSKTDSNA